MIDPFVLLTPVLLYAVVSLLRFIGCAGLLGLDDVAYDSGPTIDADGLQPKSAIVGSGHFTLTISGSGFANTVKVLWDNQERTVNRISDKQLTVSIQDEDIEQLAPGQLERKV